MLNLLLSDQDEPRGSARCEGWVSPPSFGGDTRAIG
jgi:hypothetical protein